MKVATVSVLLPSLVAGSLNHAHKHHHGLHQRALVTEVIVVTEVVTETRTEEPTTATSTLSPPSSVNSTTSVAYTLAPSSTAAKPSGDDAKNPYQTLIPTANKASVVNSCDYPVFIWSAGNKSCDGADTQRYRIESNSTYTEDLRSCKEGGISLKLSKTESAAEPMQFEYTVWPNDKNTVSYDISYLDCMKNKKAEKDTSGCAGHDGGIQAVGGGDCKKYYCLAGEWCDQMAYVVEEFGYLPNAPVGACKVDQGIAFELCAENRSH